MNVTPQFCQTEQSYCYILKLLAETYVQWPCKTSFSRHCMWRLISECCFWFAHGVPFLFGHLQWIMADLLFYFLIGLRSISSTARLSEISLWCGVTSWKSFFYHHWDHCDQIRSRKLRLLHFVKQKLQRVSQNWLCYTIQWLLKLVLQHCYDISFSQKFWRLTLALAAQAQTVHP